MITVAVEDLRAFSSWVPHFRGETRDLKNAKVRISPEDYDLAHIEKRIQDVKMDKALKSLEVQVWNLGYQ